MRTSDQTTQQIIELLAQAKREAFQEGFNQGWNAAVDRIAQTTSKGVPPPSAAEVLDQPFTNRSVRTPIVIQVRKIVREKPGLKGAEIVREIMARNPTVSAKVADRTGRTALSRLRQRGEIRQRMKKWYPIEKETTPNNAES